MGTLRFAHPTDRSAGWNAILACLRDTRLGRRIVPQDRSAQLTIFWRCGGLAFSSRRTARCVGRQPTVNGFGRGFWRLTGSGNADSRPNRWNFGRSGSGRCARDSGCDPAHPPYWRPSSYLPLRAGWALAPGHSGVVRDHRTPKAPERRISLKEFSKWPP